MIKKSRFVATAGPMMSERAAKDFNAAHSDPGANHNRWAWRVGPSYRCSDDGEPGGTAGNPNLLAIDRLSAAHRLPAIYEFESLARDGGLMSYRPDQGRSAERGAALVDRFLRGARPAELPFENPTRFTSAINLKAANGLGITVPPALLVQADVLIE